MASCWEQIIYGTGLGKAAETRVGYWSREVGQRLLNCSHANLICCQPRFASIECLSLFPRQMPGLLLSRELSGPRGLPT
jgi:hypothetical protein